VLAALAKEEPLPFSTAQIRRSHSMEPTQQGSREPLNAEQAAAMAAILAECDKLAAAGIRFVAVHSDGYGDEGTTEDVKCYEGEWFASDEHEPVTHDISHLQEHFEALVPFG
jgi:hypothetical protein